MQRPVSPLFAGRSDELDILLRGFREVASDLHEPTGQVFLVSAEAGGGKTRLIREYTARVADRARVFHGACVEVSEAGLPYAPFVATLNAFVATTTVDRLRGLLGEGVLSELARIVPSLGSPPLTDPELGRSRLFAAVLDLLTLGGADGGRPLIVVIEDLHWADAGTRDLLAYLARGVPPQVQLLATYRDTELREGHPLQSVLSQLERFDGVTRIHLDRLDEPATAAQLEGILGRAADPALVHIVHERGQGVPLFTEALVTTDGSLRSDVPASLRDLTLADVRTLPINTRQVLAAAAIGGDRVSHRLLCSVTGLDDEALTDAVRPAVAAHVLESERDGYAFRHQLIAAAVRAGVLTGDRIRLHRSYAEVLTIQPDAHAGSRLGARIAEHWHGACDFEQAFGAAWLAAAEAGTASGLGPAYDVRLRMLELALTMWDRAPVAVARTATDLAGVYEMAANAACWNADPDRGLELIEQAMLAVEQPAPPNRRASMLLERASFREQSMTGGSLDDLRQAANVAPTGSLVRAEALGQLSRALMALDRVDEALPHIEQMHAAARQADSAEFRSEAQIATAIAGADNDAVGAADRLAKLRADAREQRDARLELISTTALVEIQLRNGEPAAAAALAAEGLASGDASGLGRYGGATLAALLARARVAQGRWDEAVDAVHHALVIDPAANGRAKLLLERGLIAVLRGDLRTASHTLAVLDEYEIDAEAGLHLPHAQLSLETAVLDADRAPDLQRVYREAVAAARSAPGTRRHRWALCASLARIGVDHRLGPSGLPPIGLPQPSRVDEALGRLVEAEVRRLEGPEPGTWSDLAQTWAALGDAYQQGYALFRAAAARAATGNMEAVRTPLQEAAEIAGTLGAEPLLGLVDQLARRARVRLASDSGARPRAEAATNPFRLTDRELEVLRLVADGRTNGEIGQTLYVATKTASVHVSNILTKLGVSTRGEAAAVAHRLHIFDP